MTASVLVVGEIARVIRCLRPYIAETAVEALIVVEEVEVEFLVVIATEACAAFEVEGETFPLNTNLWLETHVAEVLSAPHVVGDERRVDVRLRLVLGGGSE